MKIGVAIPCYKYDISLLKRCLDSIEKQSIKPNIVVVSCSSCVKEDIPFDYTFYSYPIYFLTIEEKKNASENRNRAGNKCLEEGMDYITFFDCDDTMHPQRIEMLKRAIEENKKCEFIIHNFYLESEVNKEFQKIENPSFFHNIVKRRNDGWGVELSIQLNEKGVPNGHHAHICVSKRLFQNIKYREDSSVIRTSENQGREDVYFCADCLKDPIIKTTYIYDVLSKYYPEGKTVL